VKKLVELHGGHVEAHSEGVGKGSEFVVRLSAPGGPSSGVGPNRAAERAEPAPAVPMKVLVVDDNRDAADSLSLLLGLEGHEARTAYSGAAALDLAREQRPDVILLDLGMPGMDGYEVARALRLDPEMAGTTLVALTGWGQDEDRKRSEAAGFDRHLTKPVAFDALRRLLAQFVSSR
jgi:two-component system CheB/CheR fusion protein